MVAKLGVGSISPKQTLVSGPGNPGKFFQYSGIFPVMYTSRYVEWKKTGTRNCIIVPRHVALRLGEEEGGLGY